MKKVSFGIVVLAILGIIAYFFLLDQPQAPERAPVAVPQRAIEPVVAPTVKVDEPLPPAEPVERYPVALESESTGSTAPDLESSDATISKTLSTMLGGKIWHDYFYPKALIRRFVVTVDNLPRKAVSANMLPVKTVGGAFLVSGQPDSMSIAPENDQRYVRYISVLNAVKVPALVDLYIQLYPVFQDVYRGLGYPQGHFNDRLIEALDDLLATPTIKPPVAVAQPRVLYTYADAELEARSAGQRIIMRLGAENAQQLKAVLTKIRAEVLSRAPGESSKP